MLGQIVEVASNGVHLSTERGFLKLSRDGERLGEVPLDDVGAVVVHGHGATFSANLCERLAARNAPFVICGSNHAPAAMLWAVQGHHEQGRRMQAQAEAGLPLRKRLWRDLVKAKIVAQADALDLAGSPMPGLKRLARGVRSGDAGNVEAQAARRYWPQMMGRDFRRDREAGGANAMLNYGYTVLRAGAARATLTAGLHPSLSLNHQSRGDALRLADDLMEPFRPWIDLSVYRLLQAGETEITSTVKHALASSLALDLSGPRGMSPMQSCLNRLAGSLAQVFLKERTTLEFPGPPLAIDASAP